MSLLQSYKCLVYMMFFDVCLVVKDDFSVEISVRFYFDLFELKMIG